MVWAGDGATASSGLDLNVNDAQLLPVGRASEGMVGSQSTLEGAGTPASEAFKLGKRVFGGLLTGQKP